METKNVLNDFFKDEMDKLKKNYKYARFNVKFPDCSENYKIARPKTASPLIGPANSSKPMAQSAIAKRLFNSLTDLNVNLNINLNIRNNVHENANTIATEDKNLDSQFAHALIICNKIILSFQALYNKYIEEFNAPFMINISSHKRHNLRNILDCEYYQSQKEKEKEKRHGSISFSLSAKFRSRINFGLRKHSTSYKNVNNNIKDDVDCKKSDNVNACGNEKDINQTPIQLQSNQRQEEVSQINVELKEYAKNLIKKQKKEGNNASSRGGNEQGAAVLYEWILTRLILQMEPTVYETSRAMKDAFLRYQINHKQSFQELCELIC